jgi:hypothetical protein
MRKLMAVASAVVLFQTASVAQANISFSINVGGPPIIISQPPEFLYPPELGFGVAVGVPYDMFYVNGVYYLYRGGGWYHTNVYGGNWIRLRNFDLPPALSRYSIGRIHAFRDREYRAYGRDRVHYRGEYFRPGEAGREEHRGMRAPGHEGHGRDGERRGEGHER